MSLIKEFAIEPKVMATWSHFHSLWEDFGADKSRLISQYPVMWKKKVDELAQAINPPVRATAISAKIRKDAHKFVTTGRTYSGEADWVTNAVSHTAKEPFHGIIASEDSKPTSGVLIAGQFDKDDAPYKVMSQNTIARRASDIVQSASFLLYHGEEVQLIDPYFDPTERRWRNTFAAILSHRRASALKVLEIHRLKPPTFIPTVQAGNYAQELARFVPKKVTLNVYFWSQSAGGPAMHPRFLLTDIGGMNFENGLDEGYPGETTLVTVLNQDVWKKCRADYCRGGTTFCITPDCMISIPGRV